MTRWCYNIIADKFNASMRKEDNTAAESFTLLTKRWSSSDEEQLDSSLKYQLQVSAWSINDVRTRRSRDLTIGTDSWSFSRYMTILLLSRTTLRHFLTSATSLTRKLFYSLMKNNRIRQFPSKSQTLEKVTTTVYGGTILSASLHGEGEVQFLVHD